MKDPFRTFDVRKGSFSVPVHKGRPGRRTIRAPPDPVVMSKTSTASYAGCRAGFGFGVPSLVT